MGNDLSLPVVPPFMLQRMMQERGMPPGVFAMRPSGNASELAELLALLSGHPTRLSPYRLESGELATTLAMWLVTDEGSLDAVSTYLPPKRGERERNNFVGVVGLSAMLLGVGRFDHMARCVVAIGHDERLAVLKALDGQAPATQVAHSKELLREVVEAVIPRQDQEALFYAVPAVLVLICNRLKTHSHFYETYDKDDVGKHLGFILDNCASLIDEFSDLLSRYNYNDNFPYLFKVTRLLFRSHQRFTHQMFHLYGYRLEGKFWKHAMVEAVAYKNTDLWNYLTSEEKVDDADTDTKHKALFNIIKRNNHAQENLIALLKDSTPQAERWIGDDAINMVCERRISVETPLLLLLAKHGVETGVFDAAKYERHCRNKFPSAVIDVLFPPTDPTTPTHPHTPTARHPDNNNHDEPPRKAAKNATTATATDAPLHNRE